MLAQSQRQRLSHRLCTFGLLLSSPTPQRRQLYTGGSGFTSYKAQRKSTPGGSMSGTFGRSGGESGSKQARGGASSSDGSGLRVVPKLYTCRAAPLLYNRLEVSPIATAAEVKAAFRRKALQLHPDVGAGKISGNADKAIMEEAFRGLCEAYETLRGDEGRRKYDASIGLRRLAAAATEIDISSAREENRRGGPRVMMHNESFVEETYRTPSPTKVPIRAQPPPRQPHPEDGPSPVTGFTRKVRPPRDTRFIRKDADRVFESEFEGKCARDLLFEEEYAARKAARREKAEAEAAAAAASAEEAQQKKEEAQRAADAASDEMRMAAFKAAQAYRRNNPISDWRKTKVPTFFVYKQPQEKASIQYPSDQITFRPFKGMNLPPERVPEGGLVPPAPKHTELDVKTQEVVSFANHHLTTYQDRKKLLKNWRINGPHAKPGSAEGSDGTISDFYEVARRHMYENSQPTGQGQMFSMHRPY